MPTVVLGWALVFLTDTPVWGACESWQGNCVVPGALILLCMLTVELILGCCVRKERGFGVPDMLLALGMLLCACASVLEYHIGQWLLSDVIADKMGANAWVLQVKTALTVGFYLAGGLPLLPYLWRLDNRPLGIVLLLTGLSGVAVSLVSNLGGLYGHALYAAVAEWNTLSAFSAVAVAGISALRTPQNSLTKPKKKDRIR